MIFEVPNETSLVNFYFKKKSQNFILFISFFQGPTSVLHQQILQFIEAAFLRKTWEGVFRDSCFVFKTALISTQHDHDIPQLFVEGITDDVLRRT